MTALRLFLRRLSSEPLSNVDRAIAVVWFETHADPAKGVEFEYVVDEMEAAGYAKQNRSRLCAQVVADPRSRRGPGGTICLALRARDALATRFERLLRVPLIKPSNTILPRDLFAESRGYIEKVVIQINASYDSGLYDCTAVMCRRLLETLIIEVYEAAGSGDKLKGRDGHYMMLSGLLGVLEGDSQVSIGRESMRGLKAFKQLGDQSAHNRRFNARKDDIDRVRDGIRLACEELLNLAHMAPAPSVHLAS